MKPTPTYLFYDIETTGRSPCFDQAIQFAAIRTTLDFVELERLELNIKLNPDVIPSPEALLVHHIGIEQMLQGTSELAAAREIHRWCNSPGTLSLGYNTLGFDDEFLRFTFYRNLLSPYTHQFKNECGRLDLYPITVLYALFQPDVLNWPTHDGRLSLKLEHLSAANQLAIGPAHDAMVDVTATLALAKRLATQTSTWEYSLGYFNKKTDLARLAKLPYSFLIDQQAHQEGIMVSGSIGQANQFMAPVVYLGTHFHYKNQTLWLRLDDPNLTDSATPKDPAQIFTIKKKTSEPPFILPPKPHYLAKISQERMGLIEHNRAWLQDHADWFKALRQHHLNYTYPLVEEAEVTSALYQADFLSDSEQLALEKFHRAPPAQAIHLLKELRNPYYQSVAERLIGREYPELLDPNDINHYQRYVEQICNGKQPPVDYRRQAHATPQQALARCQELLATAEESSSRALLQALSNYLTQQIALAATVNS